MNDEIIATLLEWNPWFEAEVPDVLVGIERAYHVLSYLELPEIKILEGVRRAGKSTLLYQVVAHAVKQNKKVLYINFDDEILQKYTLTEIYYGFLTYSDVDYLLMDEIQQCSNWVPSVREFYDRKELKQIWITGSNSSLIKQEYVELLTGRNIKLSISPLSFTEYLSFKGLEKVKMPVSQARAASIKKQFNNYLKLGSFPAIALREVYQRELLSNYFEDFIYKDIATRYDVNISKLKDLAIYVASNSAKLFSYRKIANSLGLHPNTVNDYMAYMREVFLFDEVYKFDYSLKGQYRNDKKAYMVDTGLASAVSFRFSEDKGRMLETLVYRHLKQQGYDIYFHRGKKECDFIIKQELKITKVIQVTCSLAEPKTRERELAGLYEAIAIYQPQEAWVITLDETELLDYDVEGMSYPVRIMPAWQWMLKEK